ncbi:hypothetical protein Ae201684P_000236 [Aphanomyces euteiches]|uniref:Uncharacterized protein n=1 Tax=Aphanomyces euteiches TaxID=100861 RepID=A0A6G0XQS4_9STRA|nr:hypothetical protein Ae201684_002363 [Aphanomyces euteiches]KAH9086818.1 hypothetical protein Ae201684P_000236 [Aphanomyces euteiches]
MGLYSFHATPGTLKSVNIDTPGVCTHKPVKPQYVVAANLLQTNFKDVLDNAKKGVKFVRVHTALLVRFRWHQDNTFTSGHAKRARRLPVATRWYSNERCI